MAWFPGFAPPEEHFLSALASIHFWLESSPSWETVPAADCSEEYKKGMSTFQIYESPTFTTCGHLLLHNYEAAICLARPLLLFRVLFAMHVVACSLSFSHFLCSKMLYIRILSIHVTFSFSQLVLPT